MKRYDAYKIERRGTQFRVLRKIKTFFKGVHWREMGNNHVDMGGLITFVPKIYNCEEDALGSIAKMREAESNISKEWKQINKLGKDK